MKDVGLWRADEAQSSLQQELMYNNVPGNQANIAEPACVPQQAPFLPCWNDIWMHAPRPEAIHGMSTLISTPSPVIDTGSFDQQHQPMIQHTQAASQLHYIVRGSDGLWRPHNSNSPASPVQKLQLEQYSHNMPGSMARVSNSLQLVCSPTGEGAAYGASMCDKRLLQTSTAGAGALRGSQLVEPMPGMHASDSSQDCGIQGLLHVQQHPQQIQLSVVPDIVGEMETRGFNTGLGFSCSGNGAAVTNVWEMQQQKGIAAGVKSFNTGLGFNPSCTKTAVTDIQQMQQHKGIAAGIKSFNTGFSPNGNEAAVTNVQQMQQQTSIAAGMKSFNPGPYVSSAAVGEEQDVCLAGHRAWLENKSNTAAPVSFDTAHQLGGSTSQHIGGLQQQSGAVESSGIKWPSRMSSIPAAVPAASPVAPVLSDHVGLMDGRTSIVMQQEDLSDLKGALTPRCPPASGNTIFISSHKRPISSQGDAAFQESFQNPGKKPAAGGMPWSGQGACSRLEYLSTVAHKQVSQGTASGSSRALGPVLNTNMKPLAHQGSAIDLQNIAAQNAGKKLAAGGMTWPSGGQGACSRLEYLSTTAHKQVSQSTASGSSRALSPALNTNLKPRARQGSANDPQSIAARVRRERISERLKYLQTLIPNGDKVDMVTMLQKAINYVQCLELQIRMLKDDSLWPKALGALPNELQELQELAGPEIAGQGQCKSVIVESEPKLSLELMEKDRTNPSSSHS